MTIKDKITIVPNFLSSDQCQEIMKWIDENKDGPLFFRRKGLAHNEGIAYRAAFPLTKMPIDFIELRPIIDEYANKMIQNFYDLYNIKETLYLHMVGIHRLTPGIQFELHQDSAQDASLISHSGGIYLNDDYDDGEIVFLDSFERVSDFDIYSDDMGGFVYKPIAGDLVMFPAETWHGGRKVLRGDRDCLLLWLTKNKDEAIDWSKNY